MTKINELIDWVDTEYPNLNFKKKSGRMTQYETCDYDPYEKMMEY